MKAHARWAPFLAVLVSFSMLLPPNVAAQAATQRAGQVSRMIPAVNIERGTQKIQAGVASPVDWNDVVNTARMARARIALDDGSILNVGSESSLHVVKHDPAAQQTELELTYGRVRSKVVRITRPDGKFEVRTPAGVAGVVGTDFYLLYQNNIMTLVAFEGVVRFCNLSGQCVNVMGGMLSTVRQNRPPDPPRQATPSELMQAAVSTEITGQSVAVVPHHVNPWVIVGIIGLAVAPAIAIPLATRSSGAPTRGQTLCNPNLDVVCK